MNDEPSYETVVVNKKLYEELLNDQKFLYALQAAGIDNWEGYDDATSTRDSENLRRRHYL